MIHSSWEEVELSEICDIYDGPHATPNKIASGPIFLGVHNLNDGRLDLTTTAHISEDDYAIWTRRVTPKAEDIVFAYETGVGAAAIIPTDLRCCLGRRLGLLRPKKERVLPQYLIYAYLGTEFQETLREHTVYGSTVNRLPLMEMPKFPISLPPLAEQRKIAAILSTWDEAITVTEALIDALQRRKQALMQLLLTGAVRFAGFEGETWEEVELSELIYRPLSYGVLKPEENTKNGIPLVRIQDLQDAFLDFSKLYRISQELHHEYRRTTLNADDLILSLVGTIGKVMKIPPELQDANVSRAFGVIGINKDKASIDFIHQYLISKVAQNWMRLASKGNAQQVLNVGELKTLPLPLPSLDEQNRISELLVLEDKQINFIAMYHHMLQTQKRGLMQQLLTGALRVQVEE